MALINFIFNYTGLSKKPEDMYRIIEHFALGRRRLELFGEDHNIRPGWLTLGKGLSTSNFDRGTRTHDICLNIDEC
jgi:N6-adenosine-specific RNA methylase IME4